MFNFPEDESPLRQRLGEAAGQVLMDLIAPGDVLGLTWSRTLSGLTAALTQLPPCPIVQLTGAVPPPDGRDLLELVRSVARIGGGTAHVFYAPMLVDAATASAIRRQGDIAEAFALIPSVTIAVVSIGGWRSGALHDLRRRDPAGARGADRRGRSRRARRGVHRRGRQADHDHAGRPDDRHAAALLRGIPFVLAVAYDAAKSQAVRAAIRGGLSMALSRTLVSPEPCSVPRQPLHGGTANQGRVVRVGDTVCRPLAPCWRATHALLDHLALAGFGGAPRVLKAGPAIEKLTYIEGQAAVSPLPQELLTDQALASVADLLSRYHRAAASFDPAGYRWPRAVPARYRTGLVSHNDVHPANLVFRGGQAVALIDFDLAGPGSAVWDFAAAARSFVPLLDEADVPDSRRAGRLSGSGSSWRQVA